MSSVSRRSFLVRGTTAGVAGAASVATGGLVLTDRSASAGEPPLDAEEVAALERPMLLQVLDAGAGEVDDARRRQVRSCSPTETLVAQCAAGHPLRRDRPMSSHREAPGYLERPGRRQHRYLRVREPRSPEHRDDPRELHPGRAAGRRPQLLRVRRRRRLRHNVSNDGDPDRTNITYRFRFRTTLQEQGDVPVQHRSDRRLSTAPTGTG